MKAPNMHEHYLEYNRNFLMENHAIPVQKEVIEKYQKELAEDFPKWCKFERNR